MTSNGWSFSSTVGATGRNASRFNLLLLEHGEVFFQDYSVFLLPAPTRERPLWQCAKLRQQGRLKLCSRSLCFEPVDAQLPILKFPFRGLREGIRYNPVEGAEAEGADLDVERLFRFVSKMVIEMKAGNRIGPFVQHIRGRERNSNSASHAPLARINSISLGVPQGTARRDDVDEDWTFLFSLVHTSTQDFARAVGRIAQVAEQVAERGIGAEQELLAPLVTERRDAVKAFDTIHLVNFREKILMQEPRAVDRIVPLLKLPGCLMVTDARVYFQPCDLNNTGDAVLSFELGAIQALYKRRHILRQVGLEFFLRDNARVNNFVGPNHGFFFAFEDTVHRDGIYQLIARECAKQDRYERPGAPLSLGGTWEPEATYTSSIQSNLQSLTQQWQLRRISNFEYLQHLNTIADRSTNDLTQYPVFPWVVADYTSSRLDLNDPATFRDLSKPIGALNANRLANFRERYATMPPEDRELGIPPPFLYGTHYSTPGYVLFFLLRSAPEQMLCLQNGRWDSPDRMFISVRRTWESVLENMADLKELIPEFYSGSGHFLVNSQGLDLGMTQRRDRVEDVELPPWAKSPGDFVRKCRRALESDYVSERLHLWIDLIFGIKQKGQKAVDADNLFYYLTYEGAVDLDSFGAAERAGLEAQISEFGQCPRQLFSAPHPSRNARLESPAPSDDESSVVTDPEPPPRMMPPLESHLSVDEVLGPLRQLASAPLTTEVHADPMPSGRPPSPPMVEHSSPSTMGAFMTRTRGENHRAVSPTRSASRSKSPAGRQGSSSPRMGHSSWAGGTPRGPKSPGSGPSPRVAGSPGASCPPLAACPPPSRAGHLVKRLLPAKIFSTSGGSRGDDGADGGPRSTRGIQALVPKAASNSDDHPELRISNDMPDLNASHVLPGMLPAPLVRLVGGWGLGAGLSLQGSVPFALHKDPVTSVWLADDLCTLASSSRDASLKITALEKEEQDDGDPLSPPVHSIARLRRSFTSSDLTLSSCALTPDGAFAVVGSWDNTAFVYNVASAFVVSRREVHDDSVSCLDLVPDPRGVLFKRLEKNPGATGGFLVATGAWDATVKLWALRLGEGGRSGRDDFGTQPLLELFDMESPVTCVAVSGGGGGAAGPRWIGKRVAAGADNGEIGIWDLENPGASIIATVWAGRDGRRGPAATCCRWADGARGGLELFTSAVDGTVRRFTCQGAHLGMMCLERTFESVGIRSIVTDGMVVIGGCDDGSIRVWDAAVSEDNGGELFVVNDAHADVVNCLFIAGDGRTLVSGGGDNCVRIWNIRA